MFPYPGIKKVGMGIDNLEFELTSWNRNGNLN